MPNHVYNSHWEEVPIYKNDHARGQSLRQLEQFQADYVSESKYQTHT